MLITNIFLLSLLGLSSTSSLELRKEDQCQLVAVTSTGAAFWVPTPDAKVSSTSGKPGNGQPSSGHQYISSNEVLGVPPKGRPAATLMHSSSDQGYPSRPNNHPNSANPSKGISSYGSHPQSTTKWNANSNAQNTGTSKHGWEDWILAGTPFPRPSFINTKGSHGSKSSNRTTTSSRTRSTSSLTRVANSTTTLSSYYTSGQSTSTTTSHYGYTTTTEGTVDAATTSTSSNSLILDVTTSTTSDNAHTTSAVGLSTTTSSHESTSPQTTSSTTVAYGNSSTTSTEATTTSLDMTTTTSSDMTSSTTETATVTTSSIFSTTTSLGFLNQTTTIFSNYSTTTASSITTTTSKSAYSPGAEFVLEGPIDLGSVPPTILDAVSPPDIDMGSLDRIDALEKSNLWFNGPEAGGDEENGGVTVRVSIEYKYPSVILDHSIYIKDIDCSSNSISGRFNQPLAYGRAKTAWEEYPLIFITTTPSCLEEGEASFFLISSSAAFTDEDQSFIISGTVAELADIFEHMAIDFGKITYEAPDPASNPGSDDPEVNTCGAPSSSVIDGLPAVACGSGFDKALNDKLGYYSDDGDDQYVFSTASPTSALERRDDAFDYILDRSVVQKRGCWIFCAIVNVVKTVVKAVVAIVTTVVKAVVAVVKEVVKRAEEVFLPIIKKVVDIGISIVKQAVKIVVFIATGKYDQSLSLGLNMVPPSTMLEDSPWGDALKFYSWSPDAGGEAWEASAYALDQIQGTLMGLEAEPEPGVEFYCVNCGVSGKMTAVGSIEATPLSGVKSAQIGVHGNLYAGLYLGVNAFAKYETKYEKELFSKGLPGWSIPGIVNLGPMLTLGIEAGITIEAEGQLLTGASLNWPSFEATLDFIDDSKSSSSGWTPNIDHKFQAAGKLSAEASLGLPVSVEFGIDLLNKKFKRTVALTDTPALAAEAELSISYDAEEGTTIGDEEGECPGIAWSISLKNEVALEFKDEKDEGPTFPLFEWTSPPLAEVCIELGEGGGSGGDEGSEEGDNGDGGEGGDDSGDDGNGGNGDGDIPTLPGGDDGGDPDELSCSSWNNMQYTDTSFNSWNIRCNSPQLLVGDQGINRATQPDSMATCVNSCSNHPDMEVCIGVLWDSDSKTCYWVATKANSYTTAAPSGANVHLAEPITPYVIHAVMFADFDITNEARVWFNKGHKLYVNTNGFAATFGDPQPGVQKSFSMLYQYGPEMRVMTGLEGTNINIIPGPIRRPDLERISPDPIALQGSDPETASYVRIYDVAWGSTLVPSNLLPATFHKIYHRIHYDGSVQFTNDLFGMDTRVNVLKTGAIFVEKLSTNPGVIVPVHVWENQAVSSSSFGRPYKKRSADSSNNILSARQEEDNDEDFTTFSVSDRTGSIALQIGTDGNLFISNLDSDVDISDLVSGADFVGIKSPHTLLVGDSSENLLHYFPDELAATGASRLRLAPWDKLPKTSRLVNLLEVRDEANPTDALLVAADSLGQYAFLWFCGIENGLNKVFLVKDALAADGILEREDMKFIVSGGQATDCGPVALLAYASRERLA